MLEKTSVVGMPHLHEKKNIMCELTKEVLSHSQFLRLIQVLAQGGVALQMKRVCHKGNVGQAGFLSDNHWIHSKCYL